MIVRAVCVREVLAMRSSATWSGRSSSLEVFDAFSQGSAGRAEYVALMLHEIGRRTIPTIIQQLTASRMGRIYVGDLGPLRSFLPAG